MSKRTFPLIALALTATVLFTVVAHACSDLSDVKAILQTPCEHSSSQSESHDEPQKHDCASIRYGMLSTQASSAEPELSKAYSTEFEVVGVVGFALHGSWRSHAPPFPALAASPRLSHVVLRI
jgi:hypothetical protein